MHPSLNLADAPEGTSARTRISQQAQAVIELIANRAAFWVDPKSHGCILLAETSAGED
jgi:hypothetical protein